MADSMHHPRSKASPIHIKASHKGLFTAYAKGRGQSVQAAASSVLANPKASTTLKRRAQFAKNAANWGN
jgi:hypothetical protein